MLGKHFGTFACPLYIMPCHADTDFFTMSDKGNRTVWRKIPACMSNTMMVCNQWLILIHFWWVTNDTGQCAQLQPFLQPKHMMVWFIFDKWKVNSTVCVEPFLQPMHMTVFSQLVISPAPISLKGNLVEDWTYLREKTWKKVLTNNPQNSVLGKETYQKAKNLLVGDHSLHCWALLI